jgi:hypothetical protein
VSRAARTLCLVALLAAAAALVSGVLLAPEFRALLGRGAGAAADFSASPAVRVHAACGHLAAAACLPLAAVSVLLALHGLLSSGGPKARAALVGLLGPLALALAVAAEATGFAAWERTRLGELDAELLLGFLRRHGHVAGSAFAGALLALAAALALLGWSERARPAQDD